MEPPSRTNPAADCIRRCRHRRSGEQITAGRFRLEDKYRLTKEDILPGAGIMRSLDPGAVVTVKD
ncbi:MAG: serine hydrolase [Acidobacteria bacterium]|nr:serine hydrolase [Acidobacteriota bacterium]